MFAHNPRQAVEHTIHICLHSKFSNEDIVTAGIQQQPAWIAPRRAQSGGDRADKRSLRMDRDLVGVIIQHNCSCRHGLWRPM
jgi:hypothetical protein